MPLPSRHATLHTLLALVLLVLAGGDLLWLHRLESLDQRVGDVLLRWQAHSRPSPANVVVIDIDQPSLKDPQMFELAGAWPWPRVIHAELIEQLAAQQPRAIVIDLIFNTPDRFRPHNDAALAQALRFERAFVPMVLMEASADKAPLALAPPAMGLRALPGANPEARYGIDGPAALPAEVWRTGYINFIKDADGTGRETETGRTIEGWWIPHLVGRVAQALHLPQPAQPRFRLHWYGQEFTRLPYAQAYLATQTGNGHLPFDARDKIIILGSTAPGLLDFVPTPLDATTPGVFVLATALANLQAGDWLRDAPFWASPLLALLTITGVALAFALHRPVGPIVAVQGLVILLVLGGSAWLLGRNIYWMPVSALVWGAIALLAFGLLSSRLEMGQRRYVQAMFSRFVDPRIVAQIADTQQGAQAQVTASREITVLFSDIRGFTNLSEHRPPEAIVALLNAYFDAQVQVIFARHGTLDKFIGDAIMAFWGAPMAQADHARLAVDTALAMGEALERFMADLNDPTARFDIGVGVHTGPAVVGFLGSSQRLDYTAIGDTVNLASRIESATKGVARVLVSEATRDHCGDAFDFIDRGAFTVKGREQAVRLFEPRRCPS